MSQTNGSAEGPREQLRAARIERRLLEERLRLQQLKRQERRGRPLSGDERAALQKRLLESQESWEWIGAYGESIDRLAGPERDLLMPISTYSDRRYGANWPFWRTWLEHARIRAGARVLCTLSTLAQGALRGLTNYVIGEGYTARAVPKVDDPPDGLVEAVQETLDEFRKHNQWHLRQRRYFANSRRDGEVFWRLWPQDDGMLKVRTLLPEQVMEPPGCRPETDSFGVFNDPEDLEEVTGYNVCLNGDSSHSEEWSPDEVVHIKINVDDGVKRGLSDFSFDTYDTLRSAERLLANMAEGAAIQASIALIRQHDQAVQSEVQGFVSANADYSEPSNFGGARRDVARYFPGRIEDIPKGQEYVAPPFASNAQNFVTVEQASLRAVAVRWNAPEWFISADSSNNNYASALVADAPFTKSCKAEQAVYSGPFQRTEEAAVKAKCDAGKFRLHGRAWTWEEVDRLVEIRTEPPSVESRDKLQEAQRNQIAIQAGAFSPQLWCQEENVDYEQVAQDLEAHQHATGGQGQQLPMPGQEQDQDQGGGAGGGLAAMLGGQSAAVQESKDATGHEHDDKGLFSAGGSGGNSGEDEPAKKKRPPGAIPIVSLVEGAAKKNRQNMRALLGKLRSGGYTPEDVLADVEIYAGQASQGSDAGYRDDYRNLRKAAVERHGEASLDTPEFAAVLAASKSEAAKARGLIDEMADVVRANANYYLKPEHAGEDVVIGKDDLGHIDDLHDKLLEHATTSLHAIRDAWDIFQAKHKSTPKKKGGKVRESLQEWLLEAVATSGHKPGDKWQGPSGRWFTKRPDGRVVPTAGPQKAAPAKPAKAAPASAKDVEAHVRGMQANGATPEGLEKLAGMAVTMKHADLKALAKSVGGKVSGPKRQLIDQIKAKAKEVVANPRHQQAHAALRAILGDELDAHDLGDVEGLKAKLTAKLGGGEKEKEAAKSVAPVAPKEKLAASAAPEPAKTPAARQWLKVPEPGSPGAKAVDAMYRLGKEMELSGEDMYPGDTEVRVPISRVRRALEASGIYGVEEQNEAILDATHRNPEQRDQARLAEPGGGEGGSCSQSEGIPSPSERGRFFKYIGISTEALAGHRPAGQPPQPAKKPTGSAKDRDRTPAEDAAAIREPGGAPIHHVSAKGGTAPAAAPAAKPAAKPAAASPQAIQNVTQFWGKDSDSYSYDDVRQALATLDGMEQDDLLKVAGGVKFLGGHEMTPDKLRTALKNRIGGLKGSFDRSKVGGTADMATRKLGGKKNAPPAPTAKPSATAAKPVATSSRPSPAERPAASAEPQSLAHRSRSIIDRLDAEQKAGKIDPTTGEQSAAPRMEHLANYLDGRGRLDVGVLAQASRYAGMPMRPEAKQAMAELVDASYDKAAPEERKSLLDSPQMIADISSGNIPGGLAERLRRDFGGETIRGRLPNGQPVKKTVGEFLAGVKASPPSAPAAAPVSAPARPAPG